MSYQVKGIVDKAHSLGLRVHGLFIAGLPGETKEELEATLRFPFDNNFDSCSFSAATAFPGTRLMEICEANNFMIDTTVSNNFRSTNFVIPENHEWYVMSREELAELIDKTSVEFYDYAGKKFKDIYDSKYKTYMQSHNDKEDMLKKRI